MLRDFKFSRRNSGKSSNLDEIENIPINPNTTEEQEVGLKSTKGFKTPTKSSKSRYSDGGMPLRTPEKRVSASNRYGWPQKNESSSNATEMGVDLSNYRNGNGGFANITTPRSNKAVGRGNSSYSECNSTQSTPTKSVNKPPNPGLCLTGGSRPPPASGGARMANFSALSKGIPISSSSSTVVNAVEVPRFAMKEDPSFWMDHNVQVLIRVRPLNSMEKSTYGYNRCLKQESVQSISWVGQPEARFTFDHVACETVDQETLFKIVGLPMVENCLSGYNSCMFAYGQTGSGKTYTMLGDIDELGVKPSINRGMTPRIFEFLFARIRAEEESRRDERLTYHCKCSFLEIYNEQITDLLDPSSTNLLLREDIKTGVYVENLSEFEVQTVGDILKLLSQGSSNRKVAATNMNRESSRSHSVFTCIIESRWEKDSTSNLRFARLNLVDLAGSERQKTSGAEGERLKEAAHINKSLSTLGHVIMVLVDVAHAKTRHVPYRDSRLTFLLQDSLGGNSKTMIIANVSPSICSAAETLNTLKFAQRAKLIQNNAVVNEDSSGDVIALQHQIHLLKEELLALKRQNVSRSLTFGSVIGDGRQEHDSASKTKAVEMDRQSSDDMLGCESKGILRLSSKQLKSLEATVTGALRREQMAETSIKQLEAEIEQLNRLIRQREEDNRCTKMMLKFREEKIQRMENILGGLVPADAYLLEENKTLSEEIQHLQSKVDKNPEVTRFALENIRLLEQLKRFQDFYEEGEREMLLTEVSELRDQLVLFLDGNLQQHGCPSINLPPKEADINKENASLHQELKKTLNELEECRSNLNSCLENNAKLSREIDELHAPLNHLKSATHDYDGSIEVIKESIQEAPSLDEQLFEAVQQENGEMHENLMKHAQEVVDLQLELDILKIILKEERSSRGDLEEKALCLTRNLELAEGKASLLTVQYDKMKEELKEAKSIIEALESQQLISISELEDLRNSSNHYVELLRKQELEISSLKEQSFGIELRDPASSKLLKFEDSPLQIKLKKMHDSLEKAKRINMWYQSDLASHTSNEEEMDEVRRQAEAETAEAIVCLQEELGILQQEVHNSNLKEIETEGRLIVLQTELKELQENYEVMTQNNKILGEKLKEKHRQLNTLSEDFESVISEIEVVLVGGDEALKDASNHLDAISGSFPQKRTWISEQLGRMTRSISKKELMIEELNHCLEDANARRNDMDSMLRTLRGAALVITEAHQQDCSEKEKEIILLKSQLREKMLTIAGLEDRIKHGKEQLRKASKSATVAFVIVSRLSEINCNYLHALKHKGILLTESKGINMQKEVFLHNQAVEIDEGEKQIRSLRMELDMAEEGCEKLRVQLSKEKKHISDLERKLEEIEENNILKTNKILTELKEGISTLKSCISSGYADKVVNPEKDDIVAGGPVCKLSDDKCEAPTGTREYQGINNQETYAVARIKTDISESPFEVGENLHKQSSDQKTMPFGRTLNDASGRDATVALLKEEIESSLEILKVLQIEISRLRNEKEEVCNSEKRSRQGIESLMSQVLVLQAGMGNFEEQVGLEMVSLDHKLRMVEKTTEEFVTLWIVKNESHEHELSDAKMIAVQKTAETSCILAKFEEAQDTIEEADILVNELMIANETNKLEIEGMKKERVVLINERDILINEVQSLQSSNNQKDQCYENLENHFESEVIAMKGLVQELEDIVSQVQTTFKEDFMSISSDFLCLKSQLYDSIKLMQSWVEDLWSKIIVKDCVVSVLHLCHMGILLETVTGLNAENGLLHHGLCESNSLIFELRKHNFKSRRDLEICRIVEGKLLTDIKNSFDRISSKEDETGQLTIKLTSFEKKILDLQLQEDLMLQRSNCMGSELAMLTKELNSSNRNVLASLLDREKLLKDKEDVLQYQEEKFLIDLSAKDFELLVLASELEQMAAQNAKLEKEQIGFATVLDKLKKHMVLLNLDVELKEWILLDKEVEVTHLGNEVEVAKTERHDILSELNQRNLEISEMKEANKAFDQEIKLLKEVACSNDTLKKELTEVTEEKMRLSSQVQKLESDYEKSLESVKMKETSLEICSTRISILDQQNQMLQSDISLLETSSCTLQKELDIKKLELTEMRSLKEENESWKCELTKSKAAYCSVLQDLKEKKSEIESSLSGKEVVDAENHRLQDDIFCLESCISNLQTELDSVNVELNQLRLCESALKDALCSKTHDLQIHVDEVNTLKEENVSLRNTLRSHKENKSEAFSPLRLKIKKCSESVEVVDMTGSRVFNVLNEKIVALEKMFQEGASKFIKEFESLEIFAKELMSENLSLQSELERKDDVLEGLLFDLRLLQESASNNKDQKDEIEELLESLEALENELSERSHELDEAVGKGQILEVQLQEKIDIISSLELDISRQREYVKSLSSINLELTTNMTNALQEKGSIKEELSQRRKDNENLELELFEMGTALEQMNNFIESLNSNLNSVIRERDEIHEELLTLKKEFEMAKALAEENEAIAIEAQQVAETRKLYADDKEEEVRLLERSVEELECTVNVLESKVDIVKGEAELQRLQREELELELHSVKQKMHNVESGDAEMKRGLNDKEKSLQEALQRMQILERELAAKDTEIGKCKAHISELNLHAEAQACEYKQKFKALEVMAEQVKCEGPATHTTNSSINKLEKNGSRARGSGSPFKCIGLGLVQQIKSERDDELTSGRLRIEELETLAANRQKEIFMLNSRLATAESMTHDVLRDLLGLKSDITGYVSLLDNKEVQKITEEARLHNAEVQVKDQVAIKLKQQLSEFVEERKGWLEEIDRKQAEMVAAQISLEKLHQQDRLLTTENEMFKMENINHKKKVMELEAEVKKLSGQQNIQQRIHHHAKIKEENNFLKTQNEDLCSKLHRTETVLLRVKEELSQFRAANGKSPLIHFDKEQQLNDKLKETEEERMQLAHKLLALCTSILKAAGVTRPAFDISLSEAEEALGKLKDRANILDRELQEAKLKNRITDERNRLADLMPQLQSSPLSLRVDWSRRFSAPNRVFHNPCFSALDR